MEKKTRKRLMGIGYLTLNLAVLAIIALKDQSIGQFTSAIAQIRIGWLIAAILCMAGHLFFETILVYLSCKPLGISGFSPLRAIHTMILGKYYCAVTPFASGGQPFQIYDLYKKGATVGGASASLMLKFVVFELTTGFVSIFAFIFYSGDFRQQNKVLFWFAVLGWVLAVGLPLFVLLAGKYLKSMQWLLNKTIAFLARLRIIKNTQSATDKIDTLHNQLQQAIYTMRHQPRALVPMALTALMQAVCSLSIIYCLYRSFGLNQYGWLQIICMTQMLTLAVAYFPTPGATGASEGGFTWLFQSYFGPMVFAAMLLWRVITYYAMLLIGSLVVTIDTVRNWRASAVAAVAPDPSPELDEL